MKRFFSALLLILLIISLTACAKAPAEPTEIPESTPAASKPEVTPEPETTPPPEPIEPEPMLYKPMDIFGGEFNPYADVKFPDGFKVFAASFNKGSEKLQGRNPFTLSLTAEGNMFAIVAYLADISGLSENEKSDRCNEYLRGGFTEFTGTDGRVVTIRQTKQHDKNHENGACQIDISYDVTDSDMEKYTTLVRDNYNPKALVSISEYFDAATDFAECGISVDLERNETAVYVQYYLTDVDAVKQQILDNLQIKPGDWHGIPSANIPYSLITSTLVFDAKADGILVEQKSKERNEALGKYIEPVNSLVKLRFGFDDAGTCGVYEERDPYYKSVAIHRPEWGDHPDGWNIEYMDKVNGYDLRITYHVAENKYHISLDKNKTGAAFDYFPSTGKYDGKYPSEDAVKQMFNPAFGTEGDGFYDKPLAYFEDFVKGNFGMSVQELYALPKQ